MASWIRGVLPPALTLLAVLAAARPSPAGDVTAFMTFPSANDADDLWARGYGAALTTTFFATTALEAEAARMPLDTDGATMTSFTGNALFAPPIGALVPYVGVGFGIYRQSISDTGETSTLSSFVAGAKLKLGLLVVRGDYRRVRLHGDPPLPMDRRVTLGAGITF